MNGYRPGAQINVAGWDGPRHYSPGESWKDRDRRADARRERRERARRTVTRKQGPPGSPLTDSLHGTPPPNRKEDGNDDPRN